MIALREVTSENVRAVVDLGEGVSGELVASNDLSIAEGLLRDDAWLRAIYADDTPVGLVMVQAIPDWHVYHIWRLMVGQRYQGRGFGRAAVEQVIERYKRRPGAYQVTTFVADKDGNAEGFYRKLGFERDGRQQMGQFGMALQWADPPAENEWPSLPDDAEIALETACFGMLRTINRVYLSLPEEKRQGLASPWMMIVRSRLDQNEDTVKAICANGYPVGYVVRGAQDAAIKASYIAAPYCEMGIEGRWIDTA
jgi:diamine N-acetyltransferase